MRGFINSCLNLNKYYKLYGGSSSSRKLNCIKSGVKHLLKKQYGAASGHGGSVSMLFLVFTSVRMCFLWENKIYSNLSY